MSEVYLRAASASDDELWSTFEPIFSRIAEGNVER
ncbi:MAG: hypothetical protein K0R01_1664, partial [Mycobacterium sp.]|nr:hypothetical protein [Mycobacterium sp.]